MIERSYHLGLCFEMLNQMRELGLTSREENVRFCPLTGIFEVFEVVFVEFSDFALVESCEINFGIHFQMDNYLIEIKL